MDIKPGCTGVKAPERDLEALRSKVDFWETVCA